MDRCDIDSSETGRIRRRWKAGEPAALDRLFERHRGYLEHFISGGMGQPLRARIDPSDVLQETLIEAVRQAANGEPPPEIPVRLWLRQIAQLQLIAARRKHIQAERRTVRREVSLPEHPSAVATERLLSGNPSPSEQAGRREVAQRVQQALAQLSERDREIILLHNFHGLTSRESAKILGIEPAAARQRYARALIRLRKLLDDGAPSGS